jgi:hypothetical protein
MKFRHKIWINLIILLGPKLKILLAFYLEMDNLAKTANKSIVIFLNIFVVDNYQEWELYLLLAKYTYNATQYEVT